MLDRFFRLTEHQTTVKIEVVAGLTTFLTMSYIVFVQPAVLSGTMFGRPTGMDAGAVLTATCLTSALTTTLMALYARYPIALAPGMGENFFFVLSAIPAARSCGFTNPWGVALGVVFISGVVFFLIYVIGLREMIFDAISPSMKGGIAVGIGLFIAFIGLQNAGLIVTAASVIPTHPPTLVPGTLVRLNPHLESPDVIIFLCSLALTAVLHARRVRGGMLWGIAGGAVLATLLRVGMPLWTPHLWSTERVQISMLATRFHLPDTGQPWWQWFVSLPPAVSPTFMKMDLVHALSFAMWPFILIFVFMAVFDTIGTLIGIGEQAGFIKENRLPRARQAMLADQAGILVGACLGTSTTTCYIESAAGVESGGRTGLTGITVAVLFLLALFFAPLVAFVGSYPPLTASALVIVGAMMARNVSRIDWSDYTEGLPAFLTMFGIPLAYSIADGLALGFVAYPVLKLGTGRIKEASWLMCGLGIVLLIYLLCVRSRVL